MKENRAFRFSCAIGCSGTLSKMFLSVGLMQALNMADTQKVWMDR